VEVLGHQDPADEQAVHFLPDFFQALDEAMTEKAWKKRFVAPVSDRRSSVFRDVAAL
jgi:hypothetical protein